MPPHSLLSPREASCLHIETFSDKGGESCREDRTALERRDSKARVDSALPKLSFLEKNSLLPTTWSSFLESCPSVYVLKNKSPPCVLCKPGTAAWREHGLQMDRSEGVQRGQRTKPGKFPSGPVSERRAPASGPQKRESADSTPPDSLQGCRECDLSLLSL